MKGFLKIKRKNILIQMSTVVFAILIYIICITGMYELNYSEYNLNFLIGVLNWFGVLLIIYSAYSWYSITKKIFTPYIIFIAFFSFFNFGQCILWSVGIHSSDEIGKVRLYEAFMIPNPINIIRAQLFFCVSLIFFHLGALFCYKPKSKIKKNQFDIKLLKKIIFYISLILAIISVPPTLIRAIKFLTVSLQHGYAALYYSDLVKQDGITMILEIFFFPSLIGLLIGSDYKRFIKNSVYFVFAIYFILNLLQGDRGTWLYKIVPLIWLSHIYYKNIDFKRGLKFICIAIFGLYIVYALMSLRSVGLGNISVEDLKNAFSFENFPIVDALFEMGSSMGIIIILLTVGNNIWIYSNSYLVSILGMATTKIPKLLGLDIILIDNWFSQDFLNINWGAGFSMLGEAYLNYGLYVAPFILCAIGYFIATVLFESSDLKNPREYPLRYFFITTSCAALTGWSRGTSIMFLRNWFRGTLLISLIILFIFILLKRFKKW